MRKRRQQAPPGSPVGVFGFELDRVRLLDADPDLAIDLPPEQAAVATSRSTVTTFALWPGRWFSEAGRTSDGDHLSLYVVSGVLVRRVRLAGRSSVELLGPGELLRPWLRDGEDTLAAETSWRVLEPARLATLDRDLWARLSEWPQISVALVDRALHRSRSLSLRLAIVQHPQLSLRLSLILWHLADRFGRVGSHGAVSLPLHLSHETLADLVSARRPSVCSALKQLSEDGSVVRRADGTFLLRGRPSSRAG